jgi:hypothetical protein
VKKIALIAALACSSIGMSLPGSADSNVTSPVTGLLPYTAAIAHGTIIFISPGTHTPANILWIDMTDTQWPVPIGVFRSTRHPKLISRPRAPIKIATAASQSATV